MTHEPECTYSEQSSTPFCTCDALRAAYQRGRRDEFDAAQQHAEDEYQRGRSDEWKEIKVELDAILDRDLVDDKNAADFMNPQSQRLVAANRTLGRIERMIAARGDGEQA